MNIDLTAAQKDYATFLPALSGFYATYIGKQRHPDPVKGPYVDLARVPSNFPNGVESLNYLNNKEGMFKYKWCLYSAGHADLDTTKFVPKEDMVRDRFQIIKATDQPKFLPQINKSMCWKCRYVCDLGKNTFENTHIKPEIEQRHGQRTRYGEYMTKCEQIRYMIKRNGIEWVTENYIDPEHTHGRYGQGGGKIQD